MPESTALNEMKWARVTFAIRRAERRLAGAGRAPEDDRLQAILLDRAAERTPRTDERLLPDELVQGPRPHPLRERSRGARCRDGSRLLVE